MAYQYVTTTGTIVPDTGDILTGVQNEFLSVFGADLILDSSTPQGVLIAAETLARTQVVDNNAAVANQFNPNIGGGVYLWSIGALTGLQPPVGTPTLVSGVVLAGIPFTTIPAGVQAQTSAGDIFVSLATVVLPASGTITVDFQSQALGPVPCDVAALTMIVNGGVLGWETVTNPTAGVLGVQALSDAAYRILRNNTLALQSSALIFAIKSRVSNISGVQSMSILENYNAVPQGLLTQITGGSTLAGQIWGMTTTTGTGTDGAIIVGTDAIHFAESLQTLPASAINPWPASAYSTTGNISLSGLSTQGGGDWGISLTDGQIILVKNQSTASQNGLWVAHSGAWERQIYNTAAATILGSNSGISLIPNSVYTCINGGQASAIGTALVSAKSLGCGWNGSQSVTVVDPSSGQAYTPLYDIPTTVTIYVKVYASAPTSIGDPTTEIKDAIIAYTTGQLPGEPGFVVGGNVSCFELAGAVTNTTQPPIYVSNLTTSLDGSSYSNAEIPIGENQIATLIASNITVILS